MRLREGALLRAVDTRARCRQACGRRFEAMLRASSGRCPRAQGHQRAAARGWRGLRCTEGRMTVVNHARRVLLPCCRGRRRLEMACGELRARASRTPTAAPTAVIRTRDALQPLSPATQPDLALCLRTLLSDFRLHTLRLQTEPQ